MTLNLLYGPILSLKFLFFCLFLIDSSLCYGSYLYDLSLCAIFRDEAPYLKEWIEFHRLVGFQHFYLYNHKSEDNYLEVLQPYIKKGIVELVNISPDNPYDPIEDWNGLQCSCYTETLNKSRGVSRWLAFLDTDEFLFPVRPIRLTKFLKNFRDVGGVCINWHMFGTSFVEEIPPGELLIEKLTCCSPIDFGPNNHVKIIVQPKKTAYIPNPHFAIFFPPYHSVNTDRHFAPYATSPYIQLNQLRINHYWTRTEKFFREKKIPRRQKWGNQLEDLWHFHKILNSEKNHLITRYATPLRKRMFFN